MKQHDFIVDLTKTSIWIGGNRACDNCKDFIWSDGTSWDYNNWHSGEPNNLKEGYVELHGKWNDDDGSVLQGFVCKKSGEST